MRCGIFSWSEVSLQSTAGWIIIFDQYRPACISTAALCYLFLPLWALVRSSGLQRISPICDYIPVVLPSAIIFCFHLSSTVGWHEWEEELREQNKIEIMLIISRKWITRKILAPRITEVCIEGRGREKRHRTSRDVVINLPWHVYLTHVKLLGPSFF